MGWASLSELQAMGGGAPLCRPDPAHRPPHQTMLMATGIECSYPTVEGGKRRDELQETHHYERWREDFELCRSIGARYVRYGLPYYWMHKGPGDYDWSFADQVLPAMWNLGLTPIVDLCHFGVPDWVGGFQNPDWPPLFAEYVAAFAERYPWIKFYTPVNEVLVCSRFSAKWGCWNEQKHSDHAMVTAHAVQCRATLMAIGEILRRRPDAVFIQSEIAEVFLERHPSTRDEVRLLNHFRFLTFDFLYGRPPNSDVLMFLFDNGFTREEYEWFMRHGQRAAAYCVMGMDYYTNNERMVEKDGKQTVEGAMLGWGVIALDYYNRYHRPMMLTETNTLDDGHGRSVHWLHRTWHQVNHLRHHGVPVIGYTWYSLVDQVDWDIQLRKIEGKVNPNGLFTMDRKPRDVGKAYEALAKDYGGSPLIEALPLGMESLRLGDIPNTPEERQTRFEAATFQRPAVEV